MSKDHGVDKVFLSTTLILVVIGCIMFISALMGILANGSAEFSSIAFKQVFFGILLGLIACFIFSKVHYTYFKKYALFLFIFSLLITACVFIPGIGIRLNGARRWISILGFSLQPVAFLNIGFVIYFAAWLTHVKDKVKQIKYGLLPLMILLLIIGSVLLLQPDTDSFLILAMTGVLMFLVAGGKFRHAFFLFILALICISILAFTRPYIMSRIQTFMNPGNNSQTSGYQVQQSLIAIGSGQFFGRGLGQSIQKYKFLPESISDSIFAVLGEELGFFGCVSIILLFLFFIFRGFRIAINAPDSFGGLLALGIVILIAVESFVNISSTLGIIPFSGIPLAFFSQGGTSMFVMLLEMGIVLNISKFKKTK